MELIRHRAESTADLRLIGSTAPRVDDWVGRGDLRADLVEALGVVRVQLPPLRQRTEDIPLLATHFLKEACRRNGIPLKTFSRSALTLLAALPWPGNMAELRALTERLAVIVTRGVLLLEDVLANVRLEGAEALGGPSGTLREARERFERDYVAAVLQHHRGRMGDAAQCAWASSAPISTARSNSSMFAGPRNRSRFRGSGFRVRFGVQGFQVQAASKRRA